MKNHGILTFLIFAFLSMNIDTSAQVGKPDFAFPATVSKTAKADLAKAEASNEPHKALNALIRLTVADEMVDPASLQQSIRLTEKAAKQFAGAPEGGLYDCLLATMYDAMYSANRWKYDKRELPLTPLPEDLTEWSGEQFRAKIQSLSASALEKADALSRLKISDYADVIVADKLTATYYPTVLDFVCSSLKRLDGGKQKEEAVRVAMLHAPEGSPARILWISQAKNAYDDPAYFLDAYNKYSDNPAASLLLGKYVQARENGSDVDIEDSAEETEWFPEWAVPEIDSYLKRCPTAYMANWLKSLREGMVRQTANLSMPAFCMAGDTVSVDCNVFNAPEVTVALYYIPGASVDESKLDSKYFAAHKPEAMKTLKFAGEAPFKAEGKAKFLIKKYGYYVAVPRIGAKSKLNYVNGKMRCMPVYPIALNGLERPMVAVVDPKDGKPLEGALVSLKPSNGTASKEVKTDGDGVASFIEKPKGRNWGEVSVRYRGEVFTFGGVYPSASNGQNQKERKAVSVLTDRGLYHPGDKVHSLVVASRMVAVADGEKQGSVCAGEKLTLELKNANGKKVDSADLVTDDYGCATADFTLPADGMTGRFSLSVHGNGFDGSELIMVSDYRMPDFEVEVTSTMRDEPSAGCITLKGVAKYYSGMPVADAKISVNLTRSSFWRWYSSQQSVYSTDIVTDADGRFSVTFDSNQLQSDGQNWRYTAMMSAVSPSGTTATCQSTFAVGKRYSIEIADAGEIDGEKPFAPKVKAIDADGNEAEIAMTWSLTKDDKAVANGKFGSPADLTKVRPGKYDLKVTAVDTALAAPAEAEVEIYNVKSGISPTKGLWALQSSIEATAGKPMEVLVATDAEASVYCMVNSGDRLLSLEVIELKPGYKTLKIDLPEGQTPDGIVVLTSVRDFKASMQTIRFAPKKEAELKLVGETFRDRLMPGKAETWRIRLTDAAGNPVNGAVALDMFNKALDAIQPYAPRVRFADLYTNNSLYVNTLYGYNQQSGAYVAVPKIEFQMLKNPEFETYVYSLGDGGIMIRGYGSSRVMAKMAGASNGVMDLTSEVLREEVAIVAEDSDGGGEQTSQAFDYRDADVPLAIWAPMLSTDAEGNLCYTFTVPDANTTWALTAMAWTKDLKAGRLSRDFVASKPIMVTPNAPRFLRQGDACEIVASVLNNSDTACVASSKIEIFNPANGVVLGEKTFTDAISPKASAQISVEVKAGYDLAAIGYRVRTDNGLGFADGEQAVIPVLTSKAALVETQPFYLNPGEKAYSTMLPDAEGARLSLTFCENPSWTIVTALPGLRDLDADYANSAAASIFSAAVAKGIIADNPDIAKALEAWRENPADSALISMLDRNEDLKIAMLNATPWVQAAQSQSERMAALAMIFDGKDADKAIAKAVASLRKLQRADGGWAWGQWCDGSSLWTTLNVLDMLGQLKAAGWMPKGHGIDEMVEKAVKYADAKVKGEDIVYAIVRSRYPEIPVSLNGQKSIAKTTASILKHWKQYADPAYKAIATEALYRNGYKTKSKELMRSITEFGVMTPSQGLTFPSVNSLASYCQILRAYALIEPSAPQVDGLRQQLIVRKQGTDWGSAVVTTEVVSAILASGSKWTVPADGAVITAGGHEIKANHVETATGSLRADLSAFAGKRLSIATSGDGPAYGAVFAQFDKSMSEVKAQACGDLDIEKSLTVRQPDGSWKYAEALRVGDRVKVQLTIHCKRDLQYVEILDERPAAFQPADQLPGWVWAEGTGFYRENRDSYTALHVESLRPGTYILYYEMNVGQAGAYSSGVASIQSQYAPEISAHSSGTAIKIQPAQ